VRPHFPESARKNSLDICRILSFILLNFVRFFIIGLDKCRVPVSVTFALVVETVGLHEGGRPKTRVLDTPVIEKPTLGSQGIDKNLYGKIGQGQARLCL
jgi:hypothetical protein